MVLRRKAQQKTLVISRKEYNHLWSHINADQEKLILSKQEEEYRNFLKSASAEMTKTWENSIEKGRLRKIEEEKEVKILAASKGKRNHFWDQ